MSRLRPTVTTTAEQVSSGMARITSPTECVLPPSLASSIASNRSNDRTPIFICAMDNCYRLFPSRDRVMAHRKRDHDTEDQQEIITWNE